MWLRALSKCLLNADRLEASTTSLGSPLQCLTTLWLNKRFLTSSVNLPRHSFEPFPNVLWWIPGRIAHHLPLLCSGICQEPRGRPSAVRSCGLPGRGRPRAVLTGQLPRAGLSLTRGSGNQPGPSRPRQSDATSRCCRSRGVPGL